MICFLKRKFSLKYSCKIRIQGNLILSWRNLTKAEVTEQRLAKMHLVELRGFPGGSDGKESACNTGDQGSISGLERSPGEGDS